MVCLTYYTVDKLSLKVGHQWLLVGHVWLDLIVGTMFALTLVGDM